EGPGNTCCIRSTNLGKAATLENLFQKPEKTGALLRCLGGVLQVHIDCLVAYVRGYMWRNLPVQRGRQELVSLRQILPEVGRIVDISLVQLPGGAQLRGEAVIDPAKLQVSHAIHVLFFHLQTDGHRPSSI